MATTLPEPRRDPRPTIVAPERPTLVLPDEFLAYVEILRVADPDAHHGLACELEAADASRTVEAAALRERRAGMLASLEAALAEVMREGDAEAAGDTSS